MHAKSQCSPSSRIISSLLTLGPGIRQRSLSQKMAQKDPEKKMSSTEANAIMHLAKLAVVVSHHLRAQYAFRWMQGTVSIVCRRCIFFVESMMYVSISSEYGVCYAMDVLDGDLKSVEASGFRQRDLCGKVAPEIVIDDAIRCREKKPRCGI